MNDNLAEMIQNENVQGQTFNEEDLAIPEAQPEDAPPIEEAVAVEETEEEGVNVTPLCDWFEGNSDRFDNVGPVKVDIRGVDPRRTLIIAANIKDSLLEDGSQERGLFVYNNADSYQVLDLPGLEMDIFNNGLKIIYDYNVEENIYLKTYGIKSGLSVVFCNMVDNMLIPYNVTRFKKKDKNLPIVVNPNVANISTRLDENVDTEKLQILYKSIEKSIENIVTVRDAVSWFLEKQKEVYDINHLLKIDNIIIDQFV